MAETEMSCEHEAIFLEGCRRPLDSHDAEARPFSWMRASATGLPKELRRAAVSEAEHLARSACSRRLQYSMPKD
jgi:hypothetical protein